MSITSLPQEIQVHILSFLEEPKDIGACARVSKEWNAFTQEEVIYSNLFNRHFPSYKPTDSSPIKEQFKAEWLGYPQDLVAALGGLEKVVALPRFKGSIRGEEEGYLRPVGGEELSAPIMTGREGKLSFLLMRISSKRSVPVRMGSSLCPRRFQGAEFQRVLLPAIQVLIISKDEGAVNKNWGVSGLIVPDLFSRLTLELSPKHCETIGKLVNRELRSFELV